MHGLVDSFFTPWHGLLYSGFALTGLTLAALFLWNLRRGDTWRRALPVGQHLTLLGAALFLLGGAFDLLWHTLFGIEATVDALLSPSHLLLAIAGALTVTGPLRAALARSAAWAIPAYPTVGGDLRPLPHPRWREFWPALLALGFLLSLFTFFTEYAQPFNSPWAN